MAAPQPQAAPHLHTVEAVAGALGTHARDGLSAGEAAARLQRHGPNRLHEQAADSVGRMLLRQFQDVMILLLLAAAAVSAALGEHVDAAVIVVIVLLNAGVGVVQQWRGDRALQALRGLAAGHATVRRGGGAQRVQVEQLVPGDVVLLEAGNLVPADLRLHAVAQLRVDESALTGESAGADKHEAALPHLPGGDHALGDRHNMAWKGTLVTHGRASGLVVATGMQTELGRVAGLLERAQRRDTPLQQRLAAFGRRLSVVVLAICLVVFLLGWLRGEPLLPMAVTAISLAVAALPEALPAVVAVLLALGARRMAQAQALVRNLPSVETLGSVSVICTDKTGTLTCNRMRVQTRQAAAGVDASALWEAAALCNDAQPDGRGGWSGDPTETALAEAAAEAGIDAARSAAARPRVHEWPFDAARRCMTTLHRDGTGWLACTKGAPEAVLARCAGGWGDPAVEQARQAAARLAAQGMRVLALAGRRWDASPAHLPAEQAESGLQLLGLVALADPPRDGVREAVADCLRAGIVPVMITGDHPATALAIARELGIVAAEDTRARALTGNELSAMDEAALSAAVSRCRVYARVSPEQKIRIVQALQAGGQFVAMTGDGVNDAPALKQADIGVAMGRGGTDVAREASGLVLLDDDFSTIVAAVREGRRIFDNVRKFVRYALSGNSGEVWTIFLAPLVGLPIPLLPVHILMVNLVTDGLPGLALAAEPAEDDVMRRPPRPAGESVFAHGLWQHTLWVGLLIAGLCLGVQAWTLHTGMAHGQTMVFTVLTLCQLSHVLAIRSERASAFARGRPANRPLLLAVALAAGVQMATIYLPPLQAVFRTQALALPELLLCLACAGLVFAAVEAEKAVRRRRGW
ncbi:MAG: cation-translocating P-type ATPase [Aquabacterium sp.]|nr:MAG: cation-translocating P-type ATPase [Aquabacterium sp.]